MRDFSFSPSGKVDREYRSTTVSLTEGKETKATPNSLQLAHASLSLCVGCFDVSVCVCVTPACVNVDQTVTKIDVEKGDWTFIQRS